MTEENGITRAQFFKTAFKKSLGTVWDLAENLAEPLERLTNLGGQWRVVYTGAIPENQPKLIFYQNRPYFLLLEENKIRAFSGLCPNDSILLVAHPTRGFICSLCGHQFKVAGNEESKPLIEYPARANGEQIMVVLS